MNEGLFGDGVMIGRLGLDVFKLSRLDETTKYVSFRCPCSVAKKAQ